MLGDPASDILLLPLADDPRARDLTMSPSDDDLDPLSIKALHSKIAAMDYKLELLLSQSRRPPAARTPMPGPDPLAGFAQHPPPLPVNSRVDQPQLSHAGLQHPPRAPFDPQPSSGVSAITPEKLPLVRLYFLSAWPGFPLYTVEEFIVSDFARSDFLVNSMCAWSSRYYNDPGSQVEPHRRNAGDHFFNECLKVVSGVMSQMPSYENILAMLNVSYYAASSGRHNIAWVVFGATVRFAQIIGLDNERRHPESHTWSVRERELRRRIWWQIFQVDRYASISSRLSLMVVNTSPSRTPYPSPDGLVSLMQASSTDAHASKPDAPYLSMRAGPGQSRTTSAGSQSDAASVALSEAAQSTGSGVGLPFVEDADANRQAALMQDLGALNTKHLLQPIPKLPVVQIPPQVAAAKSHPNPDAARDSPVYPIVSAYQPILPSIQQPPLPSSSMPQFSLVPAPASSPSVTSVEGYHIQTLLVTSKIYELIVDEEDILYSPLSDVQLTNFAQRRQSLARELESLFASFPEWFTCPSQLEMMPIAESISAASASNLVFPPRSSSVSASSPGGKPSSPPSPVPVSVATTTTLAFFHHSRIALFCHPIFRMFELGMSEAIAKDPTFGLAVESALVIHDILQRFIHSSSGFKRLYAVMDIPRLASLRAHYAQTGPEILQGMDISVALGSPFLPKCTTSAACILHIAHAIGFMGITTEMIGEVFDDFDIFLSTSARYSLWGAMAIAALDDLRTGKIKLSSVTPVCL
nr:hypothetical protein HK105_002949 [Polyrhizophydium stewartii]